MAMGTYDFYPLSVLRNVSDRKTSSAAAAARSFSQLASSLSVLPPFAYPLRSLFLFLLTPKCGKSRERGGATTEREREVAEFLPTGSRERGSGGSEHIGANSPSSEIAVSSSVMIPLHYKVKQTTNHQLKSLGNSNFPDSNRWDGSGAQTHTHDAAGASNVSRG